MVAGGKQPGTAVLLQGAVQALHILFRGEVQNVAGQHQAVRVQGCGHLQTACQQLGRPRIGIAGKALGALHRHLTGVVGGAGVGKGQMGVGDLYKRHRPGKAGTCSTVSSGLMWQFIAYLLTVGRPPFTEGAALWAKV